MSTRHVDFLVLAALQDAPLHGYGIVRRIGELSDGQLSLRAGDVYRVLHRMHRAGLLEPDDRRPVDEGNGRQRTYYRITESGRRAAAEEAQMLASVAARVLADAGDGR